jgi:hypothetical protein
MPYKDLEKRRECGRKWYEKNRDYKLDQNRNWAKENSEKRRDINRRWNENNPEKARAKSRKWREKNSHYEAARKAIDIQFKLAFNLRRRLNRALKGNYKAGSAVRDLGCSVIELKTHLENQFQDDMSWENYGKWHIDHIIPLNSFDLIDREQFLKACHYTNLQPLWARENLSKGAKI